MEPSAARPHDRPLLPVSDRRVPGLAARVGGIFLLSAGRDWRVHDEERPGRYAPASPSTGWPPISESPSRLPGCCSASITNCAALGGAGEDCRTARQKKT